MCRLTDHLGTDFQMLSINDWGQIFKRAAVPFRQLNAVQIFKVLGNQCTDALYEKIQPLILVLKQELSSFKNLAPPRSVVRINSLVFVNLLW